MDEDRSNLIAPSDPGRVRRRMVGERIKALRLSGTYTEVIGPHLQNRMDRKLEEAFANLGNHALLAAAVAGVQEILEFEHQLKLWEKDATLDPSVPEDTGPGIE